jgi:DNA polymerase-3 subunit beta
MAQPSATKSKSSEGVDAMDFTVKKFDLLNELELVQGVVERKTTIPILSHLLCEARGNALSITATDLEISIRTGCAAKSKKDGACTIPAKKLYELVRLLPDEEIRFKLLDNHWVQITCGRKTYKMVGMAKDNFPVLATAPPALVKIPTGALAGMIQRTQFAISAEESRYTLNGAQLVLKAGAMVMVATDGHRLALVEKEHPFEGLSGESRALVPKKAMAEILRLSAGVDAEDNVEFARDDSNLFFQFPASDGRNGRLLIARMLTGQFPNFEAVLPRDNDRVVTLDRSELLDAIRRVAQLADQRSHAVKFEFTSDGIRISSSSPEYGEAVEEIEKPLKGDDLTIGFNAQYMLDFLSVAADGPIALELKDEQSAGQMRPLADEAYKYRYVIMPMRI